MYIITHGQQVCFSLVTKTLIGSSMLRGVVPLHSPSQKSLNLNLKFHKSQSQISHILNWMPSFSRIYNILGMYAALTLDVTTNVVELPSLAPQFS